ncbi:MAG: hypothetical protein JW751_01880 [Polyangiaceae bacterium]|nr:hypothetical protein [Polyangiaceae bacterium]
MSRQHAELIVEGPLVAFRDPGSRSGVASRKCRIVSRDVDAHVDLAKVEGPASTGSWYRRRRRRGPLWPHFGQSSTRATCP